MSFKKNSINLLKNCLAHRQSIAKPFKNYSDIIHNQHRLIFHNQIKTINIKANVSRFALLHPLVLILKRKSFNSFFFLITCINIIISDFKLNIKSQKNYFLLN